MVNKISKKIGCDFCDYRGVIPFGDGEDDFVLELCPNCDGEVNTTND